MTGGRSALQTTPVIDREPTDRCMARVLPITALTTEPHDRTILDGSSRPLVRRWLGNRTRPHCITFVRQEKKASVHDGLQEQDESARRDRHEILPTISNVRESQACCGTQG